MTIKELKDKLTDYGVPFEEGSKKEDLQRIHDEANEAGVFDGQSDEEVATPEEEVATESSVEPEEKEETEYSKGKYEVLTRLKRNGKIYEPEDSVELPGDVAKELVESKVVK